MARIVNLTGGEIRVTPDGAPHDWPFQPGIVRDVPDDVADLARAAGCVDAEGGALSVPPDGGAQSEIPASEPDGEAPAEVNADTSAID